MVTFLTSFIVVASSVEGLVYETFSTKTTTAHILIHSTICYLYVCDVNVIHINKMIAQGSMVDAQNTQKLEVYLAKTKYSMICGNVECDMCHNIHI